MVGKSNRMKFWSCLHLVLLLLVARTPSSVATQPGAAEALDEGLNTKSYGSLREAFEEHYNIRLLKTIESARMMRTGTAMAFSASNWRQYFVDTVMGYPVGEGVQLTSSDVETLRGLLTAPGHYVRVLEASSCAFGPDVAIVACGSVGTIQILMDLGCLTVLQFRGELGDTQSLAAIPMREELLALVKNYFPDVDE